MSLKQLIQLFKQPNHKLDVILLLLAKINLLEKFSSKTIAHILQHLLFFMLLPLLQLLTLFLLQSFLKIYLPIQICKRLLGWPQNYLLKAKSMASFMQTLHYEKNFLVLLILTCTVGAHTLSATTFVKNTRTILIQLEPETSNASILGHCFFQNKINFC